MAPLASGLSATLSAAALDAIIDAIPSASLIADTHMILRASQRGGEMTGWEPNEIEGLTIDGFCARFPHFDKDGRELAEHEVPVCRAMRGETVSGWEGYFRHRNGERIGVLVSAAPLLAPDGCVIGAVETAIDFRKFEALQNELRASIDQKSLLYEELRHRVKNHMQVLTSLIGLEARKSETVERMAESLSMRMKGLAAVYETMSAESDEHAAGEFMERIVGAYRTDTIAVEVTTPKRLTLAHKLAVPLGMLVNEAVCNAYKHAFPGGRGQINVSLRPREHDRLELEIVDNGIGFDRGETDTASLGQRLMEMQAQQLGGELSFSKRVEGGTRVFVVIPRNVA